MQARAVLHFAGDGREYLQGSIERGGVLRIEYELARLSDCFRRWGEAEQGTVEANVRFHPRGELYVGTVSATVREQPGGPGIGHRGVPVEVRVPDDAEYAELWFHGYSETDQRCDTWDSRFGDNYWFVIGGPVARRPAQPVAFRLGSQVEPGMVSVVDYELVKTVDESGVPRVALAVSAWLRERGNAWIDFHLFDAEDRLIHAQTLGLPLAGEPGSTIYGYHGVIYAAEEGAPDARKFQFRVYCELGHRCYSDGILYETTLPAA